MEKFVNHTGTAVPLRRSNVDTDQIIPAVFLKRVTRTGFGDGLFSAWRSDPDFELNRPEYQGASVLISGSQFGSGSSREHAVWALQDYGFRVVLAESFADIFRGNSLKAGLVTIALPQHTIEALMAAVESDPDTPISVDLASCELRAAERVEQFEFDPYVRWRFMEGLDDVALSLRHADEIGRFEQSRPRWLPVTKQAA